MRPIDADLLRKRIKCTGLETPAERKRIIAIRDWVDSQETIGVEDLESYVERAKNEEKSRLEREDLG